MPRVDIVLLRKTINTDLTDDQLTEWIGTANRFVDLRLLGKLSEPILKDIEKLVAAHFVCLDDPRAMEEEIGRGRVVLEAPKAGEGLKATRFGRQAITLDSTGALEKAGKQPLRLKTFGGAFGRIRTND